MSSMISPSDAAQHLLKLDAATRSFRAFVELLHPEFELQDFHITLINALDLLERGALTRRYVLDHKLPGWEELENADSVLLDAPVRRLLITMPPRHAKTTFATLLFPSYFLCRDHRRYVMSASYNEDLAGEFGSKVREYVNHPLTKQAFPELAIDKNTRAKSHFRTTTSGQYVGVGLNGTTTGRPANLLIVDDPVKSRPEVESASKRNAVWQYYIGSLESRKQPAPDGKPPIEIVILTRWHPDDLAGRIEKSEDWKEGLWLHLSFPAIRCVPTGTYEEDAQGHRFPVEEEVALWERQIPLSELRLKRRRDPREFDSLYQQSPYIIGGNVIKQNWWQWYQPLDRPENFASVVIGCDTAFKAKEGADYSVFIVGGMTGSGDIYILDVIRERLTFPELKRRAVSLNSIWRGRGLHGLHIEDRASGHSLIQELRMESGLAVIPHRTNFDKMVRLQQVIGLIEGGRVFLPTEAEWLDDFVSEMTAFPNASHDDQVDALSILLDVMSRTSVSLNGFNVGFTPERSLNVLAHHLFRFNKPSFGGTMGEL